MYTGHLGIALGVKGLRQDVPLPALVLAALSSDLANVGLNLAGLGDPGGMRSHSLPAAALISALSAGLAVAAGQGWARSGVVGAVALSHVVVDYLTSRLPLWPGGPVAGLHMYRVPAADFVLEALAAVVGWLVYRRSLGRRAKESWAAWAIVGVLMVSQLVFDGLFAGAAAG